MPARRLAALCLVVTGCAGEPTRVVVPRDVLVHCPPDPVTLPCPDWPDRERRTLRDLLLLHREGEAAHARCAAKGEAWDAAWEACRSEQ